MLTSKDKYLKYKKKYLELKSQIGGMQSHPVVSGPQFATEIPEKSITSVLDLSKYRKFESLQNEINKNLDFIAIKNNLGKKNI